MTPFEVLARASTVLLTTFRRDGTSVPTPVWVVRRGDELWVWTNPMTGKYKRIRNNPKVTLAPSTMRGTPLGSAVNASAGPLDAVEVPEVLGLIKAKYGLFGRFSIWQSGLAIKLRGWPPTGGLRITLD